MTEISKRETRCAFTQLVHELGDARAGNMVMLGALVEISNRLPHSSTEAALRRLVRNSERLALEERALARGRESYSSSPQQVRHQDRRWQHSVAAMPDF